MDRNLDVRITLSDPLDDGRKQVAVSFCDNRHVVAQAVHSDVDLANFIGEVIVAKFNWQEEWSRAQEVAKFDPEKSTVREWLAACRRRRESGMKALIGRFRESRATGDRGCVGRREPAARVLGPSDGLRPPDSPLPSQDPPPAQPYALRFSKDVFALVCEATNARSLPPDPPSPCDSPDYVTHEDRHDPPEHDNVRDEPLNPLEDSLGNIAEEPTGTCPRCGSSAYGQEPDGTMTCMGCKLGIPESGRQVDAATATGMYDRD